MVVIGRLFRHEICAIKCELAHAFVSAGVRDLRHTFVHIAYKFCRKCLTSRVVNLEVLIGKWGG